MVLKMIHYIFCKFKFRGRVSYNGHVQIEKDTRPRHGLQYS